MAGTPKKNAHQKEMDAGPWGPDEERQEKRQANREKLDKERADDKVQTWRATILKGNRYDRYLARFNRQLQGDFVNLVGLLDQDKVRRLVAEEENMQRMLSLMETDWSRNRMQKTGGYASPEAYTEGLANRIRRWRNRHAWAVFIRTMDMEILSLAPMRWSEVPQEEPRRFQIRRK